MNSQINELEIASIKPSKLNPRLEFPAAHIKSLAKSIKAVGLLEPILVRPINGNKLEIVHGECRLLAAKELGWKTIPAQIKELTDDKVMEIRLHENIFRKDLSDFEKGAYAKRAIIKLMVKDNLPESAFQQPSVKSKYVRILSGRWGVSQSSMSNWIEIHLQVPEKYRAWIKGGRGKRQTRKGIMSPYKARSLIRIGSQLENPKLQEKLFDMESEDPLDNVQMKGLMAYAKKNPYATEEELHSKKEELKSEIELKTQIPLEVHQKLVALSEEQRTPIGTIVRNLLIDHFFKK